MPTKSELERENAKLREQEQTLKDTIASLASPKSDNDSAPKPTDPSKSPWSAFLHLTEQLPRWLQLLILSAVVIAIGLLATYAVFPQLFASWLPTQSGSTPHSPLPEQLPIKTKYFSSYFADAQPESRWLHPVSLELEDSPPKNRTVLVVECEFTMAHSKGTIILQSAKSGGDLIGYAFLLEHGSERFRFESLTQVRDQAGGLTFNLPQVGAEDVLLLIVSIPSSVSENELSSVFIARTKQ